MYIGELMQEISPFESESGCNCGCISLSPFRILWSRFCNKIFKVRVDFHIFMEKIDKSIYQFSVFIKDLSF